MSCGHAELRDSVVEDIEGLDGIAESQRVVSVDHEHAVSGIRPPPPVGGRHSQRVQAETRPGRARRSYARSGEGDINAPGEHAVLTVAAEGVIGAELAQERGAEGHRPSGGQVPLLAARARVCNGDARQARRPPLKITRTGSALRSHRLGSSPRPR